MERTARLHPLLTAAAISVTVFSAVGIASLTGLIPPSIGSQKEAAALEVVQKAPKPINKTAAKRPAKLLEPAVYRDLAEAPVYSPAPQVLDKNLGTVQSVREVKQPGEHTAMGPIAGGVAGAVIGSQIGGGSGKKIMTVVGALGGAMAGKHIEKQARATTRWEIDVRHDSGLLQTLSSDVAPAYRPGDRVRVLDGGLQPA